MSINTIVNNINNKVENSLIQSAGASASATCAVTIGSISFEETNGCTITVKNLCSANAKAQVDAIVEATINFFNDLDEEQKQEAPALFTRTFGISTTVNNITNDFKNLVEQRCLAESVINNTLTIQNITVNKCSAPPGQIVNFQFINAGKATGQCAISAVLDLQVEGSNTLSITQSQGLEWSTIIWPVAIVAIIIVLAFALYYMRGIFTIKPADKITLERAKQNDIFLNIEYLDRYLTNKKTEHIS